MTTTLLLAAAFGASLFLAFSSRARGLAIGAAVVSGVALAIALGFASIALPYVDVALSVGLAVLGVLLLLRVDAKPRVIAATVLAAIGVQQALAFF